MRIVTILLLVVAGCAYKKPKLPDFDAPRMWKGGWGQHPVAMVYGSGSIGDFTYETRGTAANRDEKVEAQVYRLGYIGRTGIMIDWMSESDPMAGDTTAEAIDIFGFGNLPLWANPRLRFQSRPGLFYNKVNLKKAQATDVEPWSWGFLYELEGEVDVIKRPPFAWTVFGSGRFGLGWGKADIGPVRESVRSRPRGWEAGTRFHLGGWMLVLSWIDREIRYDDALTFSRAEYGYRGANISIGMRW